MPAFFAVVTADSTSSSVAEDARPGTAARGLHRREALHRENRRHVERHRLDKIERQALAVGERPLIEMALRLPIRVVDHPAVFCPGQPGDRFGIIQIGDEIENDLLVVAPADEVDLGFV